jgi:DNA-binding Lrp family transcriptional regulator
MLINPFWPLFAMDKIEQKLLCCLRQDGRMSLAEISRQTGIPTTTVFERMKEFKYTAFNATLLDFEKMGFGIRAFMAIKGSDKEALHGFLLGNSSINTLSKINNGLDYFCEAVFKDMAEFERFNDTLQLLKGKARVFFVVKELRKEHFFRKKEHFKLLT